MNMNKLEEFKETVGEWKEYQLLVLSRLDELKESVDGLCKKQHEHDKEIDRLKLKSGIWGLIGGFLSGVSIKLTSWLL